MLICSNCGQPNRHGTYCCDQCAAVLEDRDATLRVPLLKHLKQFAVQPLRLEHLDSRVYSIHPLMIQIGDVPEPLILLPTQERYRIGRGSSDRSRLEVDLSRFQAEELGVSRRHAVIYATQIGWVIEDLGSTNGTYLNDKRLQPRKRYLLEHNAPLAFSLMRAQVRLMAEPIDVMSDLL